MITIEERTAKKVTGITSLFISFKYNQQLVDIIKTVQCKQYTKQDNTWEVPIGYLGYLVKKFRQYDDVLIKRMKDNNEEEKHYSLSSYKTPCYPYQEDAIQYGLNHDKWLLLDVPGLGKSKQVINLIEELKRYKGVKNALIVCGVNSLKYNWVNEIHKHSDMTCKVLGSRINRRGNEVVGSVSKRLDDLKNIDGYDIVITNIETCRDDGVIKALKKELFDVIVVDEIHKIKSPTAVQSKNLLKIPAKFKIGLTGTVLLNNPLDLFVPLKFIDVENGTFSNFKNYYCEYGGFGGYQVVGYKHVDDLKDELESCSLRRNKDLLGLPTKNIITEYVEMEDDQKNFYDNILDGVISECDKADLSKMTLLSSIGRLRQVTSMPSMLTTLNISSAKIGRTLDLVEQIVGNGNKVVIFSTFKEPAKYLGTLIRDSVVITGDNNDSETARAIDEFQNNPNCKVFIGTWQKCGTGITLTAASYMIFLDTPYTDGVFQQACDRIYRIGTTSPVFIYNLVCKDTVDERVLKIINDKRYLSDYIVDDIHNEAVISSLASYISELKNSIFDDKSVEN